MVTNNNTRSLNKLTANDVKHARPERGKKLRKLSDGGGLVLTVDVAGRKYWHFRYKVDGKPQTASFGTLSEVSLKEAREKRKSARIDLRDGITPKDRKRLDEQDRVEQLRLHGHTFESVARHWYDRVKSQWKNDKHRAQVMSTLETHVFPHIGQMPVADIKAYDIRLVIEEITNRGIWETAQRTYQRITAVFDEAVERDLIEYNPGLVLRGKLFRKRPEESRHGHFPALQPVELPDLVQALNQAELQPVTRLAVELQMLTFVRPGELRAARWAEFDLKQGVWAIPADRMKMKREHLVPLSEQTLAALELLHRWTGRSMFLFPHRSKGKTGMSEGTVNMAVKRLKDGAFAGRHTAHGFRSTASTYLNELKRGDYRQFNSDAIERQLSHIEPDPDKRAYDRAEHWEERIDMMQVWADFVTQCADPKVTQFRRKEAAK
jgi:integrase